MRDLTEDELELMTDDEWDGRLITEWLEYRQYDPLPAASAAYPTYEWAYQNLGAWRYVELPEGMTQEQARALIAAAVARQPAGLTASTAAFKFNPAQPRDKNGRWSPRGGGGVWTPEGGGNYKVNIRGFGMQQTLEIAQLLDEYETLMPGSMKGLKAVRKVPGMTGGHMLAGYSFADRQIDVYDDYASGAKSAIEDSFDQHWFPSIPPENRPAFVIAHELGHHASTRMTDQQRSALTEAVAPGRGETHPTEARMVSWDLNNTKLIRTNLSGYAGIGGVHEFEAEALASGLLGDDATADRIRSALRGELEYAPPVIVPPPWERN